MLFHKILQPCNGGVANPKYDIGNSPSWSGDWRRPCDGTVFGHIGILFDGSHGILGVKIEGAVVVTIS